MFWDKNDSPSQNIEALLEKENVTVEEFLDEDDIIQECKTHKKSIVNYFTRPDVIKRMIELITTEPPEDLPLAQRFRHANVACEILLLGLPSLDEKLISDEDTLKMLYSYLENEPPLNPLLASFFSKTFSMLFTKKSDQDWFLYQQLCLKLMEFLKMQSNFLDLMCKHFSTPVIPDVIMEILRNVEGAQLKRSMYEWLNEERLTEKLIEIIGDPEQSENHANVAEFLCDLIHQGRVMRYTENDTFEPIFQDSNPILKTIESAPTLFALFNVILQPNALESAIVSGITVVLKVIQKVIMIDERDPLGRSMVYQQRADKTHDEYLTTVMRVIEPQLKTFNELLRNPPKKDEIITSAAVLSPPFGIARLQVCRLFTVLLETGNEQICKAICETDFFEILLSLFKKYCWNNFLHNEVEKCLHIALKNNCPYAENPAKRTDAEEIDFMLGINSPKLTENGEILPSHIQTHLIVNCHLISRLIECWTLNKENEGQNKGRRLGYMGHLIKIIEHITTCISESKHIGALIESNLKDDAEREVWKSITDSTDGELTQALTIQSKQLANWQLAKCEAGNYDVSLDFSTDYSWSDAFNEVCAAIDSSNFFRRSNDDDEDDEDDDEDSGDALTFEAKMKLKSFTTTSNPWDTNDDLSIFKSPTTSVAWPAESTDNFADFDAHFSSFSNDMGESLTGDTSATTPKGNDNKDDCPPFQAEETSSNLTNVTTTSATTSEEYDNNANVEKLTWPGELSSLNSRRTFVDDYEDDEGMWTKPLGESAESDRSEDEKKDVDKTTCDDGEADADKDANEPVLTNGPTKSVEEEEPPAGKNEESKAETNQLNNSESEQPVQDDNNSSSNITTNEQTPDKEVKDINEDDLINKHKSITIEGESNATDIKEATTTDIIVNAITTTDDTAT
ncbi:phosphatase 6 regulatory subunit 1-like protein fmt isoform X2 [Haematobia irritans]|uniref:phosphatase 6 regulatory subunit 1-like protein fmt isoform X2 n=1 Tax=Haematobia irritans TaxID=7368 RepID=UPI003F503263